MSDSSNNKTSPHRSGSWWSLLLWIILALLLRWQVLEPRWIPSGSMLPTLQLQDRILVEKIQPRLKGLEHKALPINSVVVFHPPERLMSLGYDAKTALIKRVVGLPGDQIAVHQGVLIRNGIAIDEAWLPETMNYEMEPITINDQQLWVLGDNRNSSLDSHLWGPLPQNNVIGTAIWRYWPLQRFGPIRYSSPATSSRKEEAAISY